MESSSKRLRPARRNLRFASGFRFVSLLELAVALLSPVAGPVTQGITDEHPALDIACRQGAVVRAAHPGTGSSSWSSRLGWTFVLRGEDGLKSSYSHLAQAEGSGSYQQGDMIGRCGNTGSWSTGTHLHFTLEPVSRLRSYRSFAKALPDQAPIKQSETTALQTYTQTPQPMATVGSSKLPGHQGTNVANGGGTAQSLLHTLEQYGIKIDRLNSCGQSNQLAAYNRAAQRLCLAQSLNSNPALMAKVVTHEAVHVTQDCLAGLENGETTSIAKHLKDVGGFSDKTIQKFFARGTIDQQQLQVATASLPPFQKQLEFEAYALQNQSALVKGLLTSRCGR